MLTGAIDGIWLVLAAVVAVLLSNWVERPLKRAEKRRARSRHKAYEREQKRARRSKDRSEHSRPVLTPPVIWQVLDSPAVLEPPLEHSEGRPTPCSIADLSARLEERWHQKG